MTRSVRIAVTAALLCLPATFASAANDFYVALLQRGISHVNSGNYDMASNELRIAAFGLVDSIADFETAQMYQTIASDKLKREPDARHAAQRLLAAERVEPHYMSLNVPIDTRTAFEKIASQILTSDQLAVLRQGAGTPAPVVATPITPAPQPRPPAPINPQPVAPISVPQPQPVRTTPMPTPAPAPRTAAPINAGPVSPIELPTPAPRSEVAPPSVPPRTAQPKPAQPQPQPQPQPRTTTITVPMPAPVPQPAVRVQPQPAQPQPVQPPLTATEIARRFNAAESALAKDDLAGARSIYRSLVDAASVDHATLVKAGEGAYRARDFVTTIRAFERAGTFNRGEEPYHYYLAVALYETGHYQEAKRELDLALPHIQITSDVAHYRDKIDGAID